MGSRWEFPGGKIEPGERDEDAVVREFEEEFGTAVAPRKLLCLGSFVSRSGPRELAAWLVDLPEPFEYELHEHEEVRWVEWEDLPALDLVESDRRILPPLETALGFSSP